MKCTKMLLQILSGVGFAVLSLIVIDVFIMADYHHNEHVVGWVKLHKSPATFKEAYLTCFYEGAVLSSPINEALSYLIDEKRNMTDGILWIGTHALFSDDDFISVEGVPLYDMPITVIYGSEKNANCLIMTGTGRLQTSNCTRLLPYMCYRHRRDEPINFKCGTFDNKYQYEPSTGSCYKLHEERHEWSRAHLICAAEGGYLAVINDEEEAMILKNMSLKRALKISKNDDWEPLFIGIRDWDKKGVWITVKGETIENVYNVWGWDQPNNLGHEQYCGSLLKTGQLDDTWCHVKALFMCEKDPAKARFAYPSTKTPMEPNFM